MYNNVYNALNFIIRLRVQRELIDNRSVISKSSIFNLNRYKLSSHVVFFILFSPFSFCKLILYCNRFTNVE